MEVNDVFLSTLYFLLSTLVMKQLHVIFTGRVQGVGFRYTAERIARHFVVTGYVRNLADGNVELSAEGEEAILKDFLKAICGSPMNPYIREAREEWSEALGQFKEFGIAF